MDFVEGMVSRATFRLLSIVFHWREFNSIDVTLLVRRPGGGGTQI